MTISKAMTLSEFVPCTEKLSMVPAHFFRVSLCLGPDVFLSRAHTNSQTIAAQAVMPATRFMISPIFRKSVKWKFAAP